MKFVPPGTAAVLELSLRPLALLAFGIALGEEGWDIIRFGTIVLGVIGLSILFAPGLTAIDGKPSTVLGLASVAWAAISSAWGSVLARPLVARYGSTILSRSTALVGGSVLRAASLVLEPVGAAALSTSGPGKLSPVGISLSSSRH